MSSITLRRIAELVAIACAISALVALLTASQAAATGSSKAAAVPSVLRIGSTERA